MAPRANPFLDYWYAAQGEPLGLWLTSPDPIALKTALYLARSSSGDPALAALTIRTDPSNPAGGLWIIPNRGAAAEGGPDAPAP